MKKGDVMIKFFILLAMFSSFVFADENNPVYEYKFNIATEREDGTALDPSEIKTHTIYIYKDGGRIPYTTIDAPQSPVLYEITEPGVYVSMISTTTTDDIEGAKSSPITYTVSMPTITVPKPPSFNGQNWTCSVNCNFEIK